MVNSIAGEAKVGGVDLRKNPASFSYLTEECEKAKCQLSEFGSATIDLSLISPNFVKEIDQEWFTNLNKDLFNQAMEKVKEVMAYTKLDK